MYVLSTVLCNQYTLELVQGIRNKNQNLAGPLLKLQTEFQSATLANPWGYALNNQLYYVLPL